ncbi:MAG: phosphate signaling complex protein PhoU [Dehalococcoidia bacterium]|nr:phosphate signaling complex protein PhoU [Dehalococcoidia bacterium]
MTRELLDQQLHELFEGLLSMGGMVEKAIEKSVQSLVKRDTRLAQEVIDEDAAVDKVRWKLEEECLRLLATQQPMATDLRTVGSVMAILADVERMGDHAEGIARIVLRIADQPPLKPLIDIPRMTRKCQEDLHLVLQAFINHDIDLARRICAEDDEVDALYKQIFSELLVIMMGDPRTVDRATYLIWVAHNLERIHDRITNVGERVVFMVTGRLEELNT